MKKVFFLSLLSLSSFTFLNAQTKGWNIGDRAAIGHSWTVGNRPENSDRKFHFSYELGRAGTYNFNETVGVGFGTYFNSQGGSYKVNDAIIVARANYIKVPIFASFTFGDESNRVRPRLTVGPSVQFLVGGKTLVKDEDNNRFYGSYTTKAMNTKIDAGANASLGLNIRVCDGFYINHDINYYHGLVDQKPNNPTESPSFTNRGLYLSMGMQINGATMKKWKSKMMKRHND